MLSITKIFEFEAAHYLPEHKGKCKNVHGHSYKLEVEVSYGKGNAVNNEHMVMDFGDLKNMVKILIDSLLDHSMLNDTFTVPTAEHMVYEIANILSTKLKSPLWLVRVRLWETSSSYAEWRND